MSLLQPQLPIQKFNLTDEQKANVRKWVEALESGKYTQAKGCLRRDTGYCCLGVACAVFKLEYTINYGFYDYTYNNQTSYNVLPNDFAKDILGITKNGILNEPVMLKETGTQKQLSCKALSEINDKTDLDFKQIAKIIREQFLGEK